MKNTLSKTYSVVTILSLVLSIVGPFPINHVYASTLWSDGFESSPNHFSNWTSVSNDWGDVSDNHSGSKSAEVKDANSDELRKNISTVGQQNLVLTYWYKIPAGLGSTDHLKVQWSIDGTTWNTLINYSNSATVANWVSATHNIPVGANDNSGFRFRFLAESLEQNDKFRLDDVSLTSDIIPVAVDICLNVTGMQETGPCADLTCTDNGNIWNTQNQTCDAPEPTDVCLNVADIQEVGPCADQVCIDIGSIWSNENQTCTEPVVDPIICDTGFHLVENSCVEDEVVPPPLQETANIFATKIICNNESDLPNWGNGGPYVTANTATDFLSTHSGCRVGTDWNFEWAPESATNPGDNSLGFSGSMWNVFGPTDANGVAQTSILSNASVWVREVLQSDYIDYSGWVGNGDNTPTTQDEVSAEIYCDEDVYNYDNFDFISLNIPNKTYYCIAFNAPKIITPPTPECSETEHLVDNICVENVVEETPAEETPTEIPTIPESSNSGSGGLGGRRHDISGLISSGGEVLGASTGPMCEEYLHEYIKYGANNNPEEVKKLQIFLNQFFEVNNPVTGFYGPITLDMVNKFQAHQSVAILTPWSIAGKDTNGPTGYVYKTTKRWINILKCPESIAYSPIPTL